MKKQVNQIFIFIGFAVAFLGLLLNATIDYRPSTSASSLGLVALLGSTFIFAKNSVVKNVGYGLCALSAITSFPLFASTDPGLLIYTIGTVIMLLGVLIYFVSLVLNGLGWVKTDKASKTEDVTNLLTVLNNYKLLEKENILSAEEFTAIKTNLLSANTNKAETIDDLKKWKKAVEQQVITEEEYNAIKSEILSK